MFETESRALVQVTPFNTENRVAHTVEEYFSGFLLPELSGNLLPAHIDLGEGTQTFLRELYDEPNEVYIVDQQEREKLIEQERELERKLSSIGLTRLEAKEAKLQVLVKNLR